MARFSSDGVKQARHGAWRVHISTDRDAFRDEWTWLESAGAATVFQSRAWIDALCDVAATQDIEPLFVLVTDAASSAPQMLLPLCRRTQNSLTAVEFLDLGASDYNAPLLASDFTPSPTEFSALWSAIRAALPAADILRIDKSPATICGRPNPLASLGFMHRLTLGAWSLRLPATREAYERDAIAPRVRKELYRKRRRLAEFGPLNLRKAAKHRPIERAHVRFVHAAIADALPTRALYRQHPFVDVARVLRRWRNALKTHAGFSCTPIVAADISSVSS